nr:toMV resistant protein Tm-2 netted virescent-like [Ziziphus jujuba var. spinosa]
MDALSLLLQKRYVVIFDDVWKVDFWGDTEDALLDNKNGGRIVITTQNMEVTNFRRISSFVHVNRLKPLPYEKAMELFCNKVFKFDFEGCCPTDLEELSDKIVGKCNGLPLAIAAIVGLLSTKNKTTVEWQKLHASLSSEMDRFVNQKMDKTLEEVALEYLAELTHRSLVQVSVVDTEGRFRTCRIHDLLRECKKIRAVLVLKKAAKAIDNSFCDSITDEKKMEMDEIAMITIILHLSDNVLRKVDDIKTTANILILDLANCKVVFSDELNVVILLNSLSETYREVKNAIKYDKDELSLEIVVIALKSRDLELKSENKGEGLSVRGRSVNRSWGQNDHRRKSRDNYRSKS